MIFGLTFNKITFTTNNTILLQIMCLQFLSFLLSEGFFLCILDADLEKNIQQVITHAVSSKTGDF